MSGELFNGFVFPDRGGHAIVRQVIVEGFDMVFDGVGAFLMDVMGAMREHEAQNEQSQAPIDHRYADANGHCCLPVGPKIPDGDSES
ncbi:MAG: hypothetical protein MRJ92_06410 [Nitrospira sp.]|nr:hypothetical protein [Nitrospira sp.]